MKCPICGSKSVKDGYIREKQRYLCKKCKYQFTDNNRKNIPIEIKYLAMYLYLCGVSVNEIATCFQLSTVSIYKYINKFNNVFHDRNSEKKVKYVPSIDFSDYSNKPYDKLFCLFLDKCKTLKIKKYVPYSPS